MAAEYQRKLNMRYINHINSHLVHDFQPWKLMAMLDIKLVHGNHHLHWISKSNLTGGSVVSGVWMRTETIGVLGVYQCSVHELDKRHIDFSLEVLCCSSA